MRVSAVKLCGITPERHLVVCLFSVALLLVATSARGGLIAVPPGKFGIAVISPPLDQAGNSCACAEGYHRYLQHTSWQSIPS
jgi:glutaminase